MLGLGFSSGFAWFVVATSVIGAPVALLCWYVWHRPGETGAMAPAPSA